MSLGQFLGKDYVICWNCILHNLDLHVGLQKFQNKKKTYFLKGIVGTPRSSWFNPFRHWSVWSTILGQNDQNAPSQPRVDQKSKLVKNPPKWCFSCFYIKLENIRAFCQLWPNLTYGWLFSGNWVLTFDLTVWLG